MSLLQNGEGPQLGAYVALRNLPRPSLRLRVGYPRSTTHVGYRRYQRVDVCYGRNTSILRSCHRQTSDSTALGTAWLIKRERINRNIL